jgi:hypothetical protein
VRVDQPYGKRYEEESFSQEPKRRYFIACEGEKTEYHYFYGIAEYRDEIGIHPLIEIIPVRHDKNTGSNPVNIYKEATDVIKTRSNFLPGDKICIIADRDKHSFTEKQYQELLNKNENKEIIFCVSNPSFEFWLLLHLCDAKEFDENCLLENKKTGDRTQVELYLMGKLDGGYNKRNIHFRSCYKDSIKTAIENSKLYATDCKQLKNKVGTNLGLLIEEMLM